MGKGLGQGLTDHLTSIVQSLKREETTFTLYLHSHSQTREDPTLVSPFQFSDHLPTLHSSGTSPNSWTDLAVGLPEGWSKAGGVRGAEGSTEGILHPKLKLHISPHFLRTHGHPPFCSSTETSGETPIRELVESCLPLLSGWS